MDSLVIMREIGMPVFTLVFGWFANAWRNKQKKEKDVLDNVVQILDIQKAYIAEQDKSHAKDREIIAKIEAKLDSKERSIRQANYCKFTNEGNGCPVLNSEEKSSGDQCRQCKFKKEDENDAQSES